MRFHLRFPSPGFFLNDPRLVVWLGDRALFDGRFKEGFDVSVDIPPGRYVLTTTIETIGALARTQKIDVAIDAEAGYRDVPAVEATLHYSRLTGNFKPRLSLSAK